mgnify:CR=1 FL=1
MRKDLTGFKTCEVYYFNWLLKIPLKNSISDAHYNAKKHYRFSAYMFLRYCPPTLNKASVICPNEQTLVASINLSNKFSFSTCAWGFILSMTFYLLRNDCGNLYARVSVLELQDFALRVFFSRGDPYRDF